MTYNPYFDTKPSFASDDAIVLEAALDETCQALCIPPDAREDREIIAARIVDLARAGLVDRTALRQRVLNEARTVI